MPIIKSASKRMRQNTKKYRQNLSVKRNMRRATREVTDLISSKKEKPATEALAAAQKAIDKAAKKGVIHKNTAARKKSQLMHKFTGTFSKTKAKKSAPKATKKTTAKPKSKTASKAKTTTRKSKTTK